MMVGQFVVELHSVGRFPGRLSDVAKSFCPAQPESAVSAQLMYVSSLEAAGSVHYLCTRALERAEVPSEREWHQ